MRYPKVKKKYSRFNENLDENSKRYIKYMKKHNKKVEKYKNKNSIFSITALITNPSEYFDLNESEQFIQCLTHSKKHARAVGFFFSLEAAEKRLINNTFDLYENGYYPYAVIERKTAGLYSYDGTTNAWWYKWDKEGYIKINEPINIPKAFTILDIG